MSNTGIGSVRYRGVVLARWIDNLDLISIRGIHTFELVFRSMCRSITREIRVANGRKIFAFSFPNSWNDLFPNVDMLFLSKCATRCSTSVLVLDAATGKYRATDGEARVTEFLWTQVHLLVGGRERAGKKRQKKRITKTRQESSSRSEDRGRFVGTRSSRPVHLASLRYRYIGVARSRLHRGKEKNRAEKTRGETRRPAE